MLSTEQKHKIIGQMITSGQGRQRLAASMISPLRQRRDYTSCGRKAFYVEQLPDGAMPVYDKDPNVVAYMVAEEGENLISVAKSQRIHVPLFEIASNPQIALTEIKARRFDLVDRALDRAKAEIQAAEDTRVFATMDATAADATNPNKDIIVTGNLNAGALIDAFGNIEANDLRVATVFMNAKDFADLRKWDRDTLDPITQGELLHTGYMANIYGAKIVVSRIVPVGTVYVCAEPEFFGRIAVRTELTVLSADDPVGRKIGFSVFEQIGVACHNPYGIQRILVTRG
jgi:folate-dependent phosphoribosylglycinamide formyltransferase PurN